MADQNTTSLIFIQNDRGGNRTRNLRFSEGDRLRIEPPGPRHEKKY
jgi:hypothetical protein